MRRIFIGDIHGCCEQLSVLLKKVRLDRENDTLIFLGDYVDRGPDSAGVLMLLKELKEQMGERCHLLLGNHEEASFANAESDYEEHTLRSFQERNIDLFAIDDVFAWLRENTGFIYRSYDVLAVHAGLEPFMVKEGYDDARLRFWPDVVLHDRENIQYGLYNEKPLICGHTPYMVPMWSHDGIIEPISSGPLPDHGMIDIDTYCFGSGRLTALVLENGQMRFISTGGDN